PSQTLHRYPRCPPFPGVRSNTRRSTSPKPQRFCVREEGAKGRFIIEIEHFEAVYGAVNYASTDLPAHNTYAHRLRCHKPARNVLVGCDALLLLFPRDAARCLWQTGIFRPVEDGDRRTPTVRIRQRGVADAAIVLVYSSI